MKTYKLLTDRTEIARAINLSGNPVIVIDVTEEKQYGCLTAKVRIDCGVFPRTGERRLDKSVFYVSEDGAFINKENVCLKASFSYEDAMEIAEYANTPIVKGEKTVTLVAHNPKTKACRVATFKLGKQVNWECYNPISIDEKDGKMIANMVNVW